MEEYRNVDENNTSGVIEKGYGVSMIRIRVPDLAKTNNISRGLIGVLGKWIKHTKYIYNIEDFNP